MDAIALLTRDHQEVERLFKQFEKLTERAQKSKQKIVTNIIREVAIHSAVEEMLFYPVVRTAALKAQTRALREAADTVLESLEQHHVVKWTLSELEKMKPEDERYDAKVKVLMESVRHHVEEEQGELFPKVRRLLDSRCWPSSETGSRRRRSSRPPGHIPGLPTSRRESTGGDGGGGDGSDEGRAARRSGADVAQTRRVRGNLTRKRQAFGPERLRTVRSRSRALSCGQLWRRQVGGCTAFAGTGARISGRIRAAASPRERGSRMHDDHVPPAHGQPSADHAGTAAPLRTGCGQAWWDTLLPG